MLIISILALLAAACGGDGAGDAGDGADEAGGFEASFSCDGLADRWVSIQQEYLDKLGSADAAELEERTDRVLSAGQWVGRAMLEQVRDGQAVGCDEELAAGAPALCGRIDLLEPGGGAAEMVMASLREGCNGS